MGELTSSPIRCPCGELEELRKAKVELSDRLEKMESAVLAWKNEAYTQYVRSRDENQQLREDNAQLRRTILALCGLVKNALGDDGGSNDVR